MSVKKIKQEDQLCFPLSISKDSLKELHCYLKEKYGGGDKITFKKIMLANAEFFKRANEKPQQFKQYKIKGLYLYTSNAEYDNGYYYVYKIDERTLKLTFYRAIDNKNEGEIDGHF